MFGSSIIVFRESLEAALLIGIIAAATRGLPGRARWIAAGTAIGLLGSLAVAALTESIAEMAGGSGQELFNAAILGVAVLMIGWHNIWMASHGKEMAANARRVGSNVKDGRQALSAVAVAIALTVLREGSETALFLHGLMASNPGNGASVLTGGLIGLLGGAGLGLLVYRGLLHIPLRRFFTVTGALLLLVASGLAAQMAKFLIQADLITPLATPLWNWSGFLPANAGIGAALHVLLGYESEPTGMQVLFYLVTLVAIAAGTLIVHRRSTIPLYKLKSA
ncbi:MAG: iron permease [Herminiimonas sp.]|nr:iron permease [Herminiimonas sp.]MDB5856071.1 iron permease [Herminiimonas sp.]